MSCTAAHLRSRSLNIVSLSDMIEGSYRSWDLYTTGQLVDGLQQKKKKKRKPVFIKRKWNHVVFARATILSFHSVFYIEVTPNSGPRNIRNKIDSSISLSIYRLQTNKLFATIYIDRAYNQRSSFLPSEKI